MVRASISVVVLITIIFCNSNWFVDGLKEDFSILDFDFGSDNGSDWFYPDYSPPSPPPPPPPPHPPSVSCEEDFGGIGSLNTSCKLNTSLELDHDVYIEGTGSFDVLPGVMIRCVVPGCMIIFNMSRNFSLGENASIVTGAFVLEAWNVSLHDGSLINTTALGGKPPTQTSGTPQGIDGAGGGYGGRGACCLTDTTKIQDDVWGGDTYSWSSLTEPDCYGSKGGSSSREKDYGGGGGGRIWMTVKEFVEVNGTLLAEGGDGGLKGGGGSGGSVYIKAPRMKGDGKISASGGNGWAGGGGGRVSLNIFSRHDDPKILVHGGKSFGCEGNSGAAGTLFDTVPRSLIVSNHNLSTQTDTLLLEFPNPPVWSSVYVHDRAKVLVPLLWSRVQVQGQLKIMRSGVLAFGLAHYPSSEFELIAEELLMSDSVIKVYGALRMSVKVFLMLNSKMLIDGGEDVIVATSLLEASNLLILKESSIIHSNANLGVHGQGALNLTGPGNQIEAQRLILSLFYSIHVGPGSVLRGPLENATSNYMTPRLYCEVAECPMELIHPPEDCNVNSSLPFTLQICRVEDITVEGTIQGSVVQFHRARAVVVESSGEISASGLGCTGGVGRGEFSSNGIGGGGGHGGKGGDGYFNGSVAEGGVAYGNVDMPCELGSGSGNDSLDVSTAGGGIVVMGSMEHSLASLSVHGSLRADGESYGQTVRESDIAILKSSNGGPGGGSGGTVLLFLQSLTLDEAAVLSSVGGHGSQSGGGGGGGGRIHFHWSDIPTGDEYQPLGSVKGNIHARGGLGNNEGYAGGNGTVTGKACPKGLYGIFCEECPPGTYKNVSGSDRALCHQCPPYALPHRAIYKSVR
ncbi:hypothetical protein GIB67_033306, partial [Kingdonia uniflora]